MGSVDSRFLHVNGVRLHVSDFGGDGPPLIMLHSTGFGQWMWQPMVAGLSCRFHLYAPEQRGHGDSDRSEDGYDFETLARDMDGVLDSLGLAEVHAMGHSSGGTTLAAHAALFPGRIRRLLLVEPILPRPGAQRPSGGRDPMPNPMAERARRRRATFESAEAMFESFRDRSPFDTWPEETLRLYCTEGTTPGEAGVTLKCPPDHEARFYDAVSRFDVAPVLQRLRLPVRFLWGETGNRRMMGAAEGPEALVPGAETKVIAGASHFLPMEMPDLVVGEALEFFGEDRG